MSLINSLLVQFVQILPKKFVRIFADRYIAGETLEEAVALVKKLNSKNILVTMDVLGEDTTNKEESYSARNECLRVLDTINKEKLNSTLSIKLTQFGLKLDKNLCFENVHSILTKAKHLNNYVEIDMEDSTCTDETINIFKKLRNEFDNCGMVIQAYLKRSLDDLQNALPFLQNHSSVRVCKGIYNESHTIAFKERQQIRDNYIRLLDFLFGNNVYIGIATHDIYLINEAKKLIKKYNKTNSDFEFQMLLGVKVDIRDKLVAEGYKVRTYVPYGTHWYGYSIRRMKENPELARSIALNIFAKR